MEVGELRCLSDLIMILQFKDIRKEMKKWRTSLKHVSGRIYELFCIKSLSEEKAF
jgi:hypothetical protein